MSRRLRRSIALANHAVGRRFGRAIARYPAPESLDAEIRHMIETYGLTTIIDVGAHVGGFAVRRRRFGFTGRIISFEPFGPSYSKLCQAAAEDPLWDMHEVALGSSNQTAEFHSYLGDGQFNSFRVLSDHAHDFQGGLNEKDAYDTEIWRLDAIWSSLEADPTTSLLKIDTQGYDLEVVQGAGELLADIPAVLTEVAVQPIYSGAPLLEEVVATMRELGFELTGAFPIHRYGNGLRVIEFDCTFCNVR